MKRIAIIDLGTNTFNLLIVEINESGGNKKLYQTKIAVKLGEGGINKNHIAETPFNRGIEALLNYKKIISEYNATQVFAFATSAIRSASNGKNFVATVKEQVGFDVNVIDGNKEAELIYLGVKQALEIGSKPCLIMDIGGGSTEFIIADNKNIFWKQSFNIGAARLLEKFNPPDPIKKSEIAEIENYLKQQLTPLSEAFKLCPFDGLIGSSGSFDTLAEMIAHKFYSPEMVKNITYYDFNLKDVEIIIEQIIKSNKEERLNTKGLIGMRVDMIVIASICVDLILKMFPITSMRLSTYSLKEGVLSEYISNNSTL